MKYAKIFKIGDKRLDSYVNRTCSGNNQVFYKDNDSRDFERFRAEGGNRLTNIEMHDKPDTIRIIAPEKHYYSELIDGEWWWVNGCAECNGQPRNWMTYIECEKHDVCRTCKTPRQELKEPPWGGENGWQCKPCADKDDAALKAKKLQEVADKEYDTWDYFNTDEVTCPHCSTEYKHDETPDGGNYVCDVCEGTYSLEINHSISYITSVIGERLTPESASEIKEK